MLVLGVLGVSSAVFVISGYSALYQAWVRGDLAAAVPYLPWARSSGLLAVAGATAAFAILFSSHRFPMQPKLRLWLSLLAAIAIALFSEFRNEGKFYFKGLHHFLVPGEWLHDGLNQVAPALGDFLYRVEFSHWNDFLIGPAIVSVIWVVVFGSIYRALDGPAVIGFGTRAADHATDLDNKLQSARIIMNVGLLWFFIQAWGEKAGYFANRHSRDPIDLPFEFAGTALGFWMARVLTRPFDRRSETFRSTLLNDIVASGVIGLLYTLVVGPLTEGVGRAVGHALYPVVPAALEVSAYTPAEQHARPLELLLLAAATWWVCNLVLGRQEAIPHGDGREEPRAQPGWHAMAVVATAAGVTAAVAGLLATMFSLLEPQGPVVTLTLLGVGLGIGAALVVVVRRAGQRGVTTLFGKNERAPATAGSPGRSTHVR